MKRNSKGQFKKGIKPWNTGKRYNLDLIEINRLHWEEEKSILDIAKSLDVSDTIIRIRLKENGYSIRKKNNPSKKTKEKISRTMKERMIHPKKIFSGEPWNKGKIGLQVAWNKGIKTDKKYWKLRTFTKDTIRKIKESRAKQIFPLKDTKIEIKIKDFLDKLCIRYKQHKMISEIKHCYQCDFYIPKQKGINNILIIEADGCYWHSCPICNLNTSNKQKKQMHKDNKRTAELKGQGYKVIRIWEHEIKHMNLDTFKYKLGQVFK